MKKYSISILLMLVCFPFIFMSCEKEKETTPWYMNRKFLLVDLQTNIPIDLNFDGIENTDLRKEADAFKDCYIYITNEIITIAWPEVQVGDYPDLTSEPPTVYTGQDIRYFIVPRYYYSDWTANWNDSVAEIFLTEEIREKWQKSYFEYQRPDVLIVEKNKKTISFMLNNVWQNFLTKDGIKSPGIIAVFKPDPADGYVQ